MKTDGFYQNHVKIGIFWLELTVSEGLAAFVDFSISFWYIKA